MKRPRVVGLCLASATFAAVPLALAQADEAIDTFSVAPQQAVSFGSGDGDSFSVEQISPSDDSVTVLLRPMGEGCTFRFPVLVGRSVQLRADAADGHGMMCKATLQPLRGDGSARFGAECYDAPVSRERKCPPEGDTAAIDYPQH